MTVDDGGGSRRPFGPHGEDCQCDEHTAPYDQEEFEQEEEQAPSDDPSIVVIVGIDNMSLAELVMTAVSDAYSAHFQTAIEQCVVGGEPLSKAQIQHLTGGLMRGHALARSASERVTMQFYMMMQQQAAREGAHEDPTPEEEVPAEPKHSISGDIERLFEQRGDDADS
jgi:hypothetical protein